MTIKEAAQLIGVPSTTYRDWEYGRAITGQPYVKIAKAFSITLNTLFEVKEDSKIDSEERIDRLINDLRDLKQEIAKSKRL
jgi:transcriptional regulator with XRE-family HTH domain